MAGAPIAAICLALVELITFFDNAVVATGNRVGINDHNEKLNRSRFFLHAVFIAALIPVYAGIGQLAGVAAFNTQTFWIVITVLTTAVVLFGYFVGYRKIGRIVPVNYYGCLRYAQSVSDQTRHSEYNYSQAELELKGFPPFTSIITVLIGLILSIWIGISADVWLPAIVTGLMMLAGRFPLNAAGALITSSLEIIFSAGLVYSLVSLTSI